mgnify:CR=1 FL=1
MITLFLFHLNWGLINGFVRPAVPLFLIASAYLLIPLRTDTKTFFRKRFMRVVIPFVIWLFMYAVLPGLWGEFSNEEVKNNLSHIFINFIPRAMVYIYAAGYLSDNACTVSVVGTCQPS